MENRNYILSQTLSMLVGELICSALMCIGFALAGYFDISVILGALVGTVLATANHAILVLGVVSASKKAENQDVKGGQMAIQMSYMGRIIGLFAILVVCAKSGLFHVLALALPLLFARPILTVTDRISNKKGGLNS